MAERQLSPGLLNRAAAMLRDREQQLRIQENAIVEQGMQAPAQPMPQGPPQMPSGPPQQGGGGGMPAPMPQGGPAPSGQQLMAGPPVPPQVQAARQAQLAQLLRQRQGVQ